MNQNMPSDYGIKLIPRIPFMHIALDALNVAQHLGAGPLLQRLQRASIKVQRCYPAASPYNTGCQ